jgi:hypothetical protein
MILTENRHPLFGIILEKSRYCMIFSENLFQFSGSCATGIRVLPLHRLGKIARLSRENVRNAQVEQNAAAQTPAATRSGQHMTDHALFRARLKVLGSLVGSLGLLSGGAGAAQACACDPISPAEGFARAQYVFTGKVVETTGHTWTVDVDRVWKGAEKLASRVRLLDVYDGIDCEFYFELGRTYIFFAIVAKSSRYVYYQSEVCNWTRALHSTRVAGPHGPLWLEEAIVQDHGPGEAPKAADPWERPPGGGRAAGQ